VGELDLVVSPNQNVAPKIGKGRGNKKGKGRGGAGGNSTSTAAAAAASVRGRGGNEGEGEEGDEEDEEEDGGRRRGQFGAIDDGVQLIAKALEGILRGLCLKVVDVTVQVNSVSTVAPGGGTSDGSTSRRQREASAQPRSRAAPDAPAVLLRLDELDFRDRPLEGGTRGGAGGGGEGATQEKVVTFRGFSLEVASAAGAGSDAAKPPTGEGVSGKQPADGDSAREDRGTGRKQAGWCGGSGSGSGSDGDGGEGDGWSVPSLPQEPEWCVVLGGGTGGGAAGLDGTAAARLTWDTEDAAVAAKPPTAVAISLVLSPLRLRAGPAQVAALACVAAAYHHPIGPSAATSSRAAPPLDDSVCAAPPLDDTDSASCRSSLVDSTASVSTVASEEWGSPASVMRQSFMEDLCGDALADTTGAGAAEFRYQGESGGDRQHGVGVSPGAGESPEDFLREVEQGMRGISAALEHTGANVVDLVSHAWSAMQASTSTSTSTAASTAAAATATATATAAAAAAAAAAACSFTNQRSVKVDQHRRWNQSQTSDDDEEYDDDDEAGDEAGDEEAGDDEEDAVGDETPSPPELTVTVSVAHVTAVGVYKDSEDLEATGEDITGYDHEHEHDHGGVSLDSSCQIRAPQPINDARERAGKLSRPWDAAFSEEEMVKEHLFVEARAVCVTVTAGRGGGSVHARFGALEVSEFLGSPLGSVGGSGGSGRSLDGGAGGAPPLASDRQSSAYHPISGDGGGLRHVGGAALGVLASLPPPPCAPGPGGRRAVFAPQRHGALARAPLLHFAPIHATTVTAV
jgi:hypothetical protein